MKLRSQQVVSGAVVFKRRLSEFCL